MTATGRATPAYSGPQTPTQLAARLGVAPEEIIKLDANENPYGPPPATLLALQNVAISRYPDPDGILLKERIADYTGTRPEQIVLGNGSDELIDLLCRLLLHPGDEAIVCPPTFSVYAIAAQAAGATVVEVLRLPSFQVDPEGVCRALSGRTRLVFLCSPNNPTGEMIPEAGLIAILAEGATVLLDEAYAEFAGWSALRLVGEYPNLMLLRTFSKAFGLAGLRAGYGIFPGDIASAMQAARLPYNVNSVAQVAAAAALDDRGWVERHVELIVAERDRLSSELQGIGGLQPLPSAANFLMVKVTAMPADLLYSELLNRGIMVRYFTQPDLSDFIRVTTGTPAQNDALLRAITDIVRS
jgi:histidinol-phosphate aminotransferase